jgi:hypothetical protein
LILDGYFATKSKENGLRRHIKMRKVLKKRNSMDFGARNPENESTRN